MEEMPRKSAAELEAECPRLLAMDPHTRGIKRVEIIRTYPKGTGPNWTYGALDPMPTRAGVAIAQTLIASVYGRWALALPIENQSFVSSGEGVFIPAFSFPGFDSITGVLLAKHRPKFPTALREPLAKPLLKQDR